MPCILSVKPDVFHIVCFRIADRVPHCVRVGFHTKYLSRFFCCNHADRSGSAVCVHNRLLSGQIRQLDRFFIKLLSLNGINLIKGAGRNLKATTAEPVHNVAFAPEHLILAAQHKAVRPVVDILDNRCDFRMLSAQGFHKVSLGRKNRGCRYQNNHDFIRKFRLSDQDVPQQTITGIFIINLDLKRFEQAAHCRNNCICFLIFNQAGLHRQDPMSFFFINPGNLLFLSIQPEHRLYLMAIMPRIFVHSNNRTHLAVLFHQFLYLMLLCSELFLVGQVQILTAAALAKVGTFFS